MGGGGAGVGVWGGGKWVIFGVERKIGTPRPPPQQAFPRLIWCISLRGISLIQLIQLVSCPESPTPAANEDFDFAVL